MIRLTISVMCMNSKGPVPLRPPIFNLNPQASPILRAPYTLNLQLSRDSVEIRWCMYTSITLRQTLEINERQIRAPKMEPSNAEAKNPQPQNKTPCLDPKR